jgi:hypothetical protein
LELTFADGSKTPVDLVKGFFIYEIPSDHLRSGNWPTNFVAYAGDDEELARTALPNAALSVVFDGPSQ